MSVIRPRLILGNYEDAMHCQELNVTHVLSCVAGWRLDAPKGITHKHIEVRGERGGRRLSDLDGFARGGADLGSAAVLRTPAGGLCRVSRRPF